MRLTASRVGSWLRRNLFSSLANTALTILSVAVLLWVTGGILRWAVLDATVSGATRAACGGEGACWVFIRTRMHLLIYGHYPAGSTWRIDLAAAVLAAICIPLLGPRAHHRRRALLALAGYPVVAGVLLVGGIPPLAYVDPDSWGGLTLNVIVTVAVTLLALPLGTALALGRQSALPVTRSLCTGYIEFWRGVPLLGVLFMATAMLPLFLPQGVSVGRLLRVVVAIALFYAAYIAEAVRGGLQSVAAGQEEAAASLGLRPWQNDLLVILPQALRQAIPSLVNTVIDLFKDTTLVSIIGLYEMLGTVSQALRDPAWLGLADEGFAFTAAVFFGCCFCISLCSRSLERRQGRDRSSRG